MTLTLIIQCLLSLANKKNNKQHKNKYLKHHLNSKAVINVENLI